MTTRRTKPARRKTATRKRKTATPARRKTATRKRKTSKRKPTAKKPTARKATTPRKRHGTRPVKVLEHFYHKTEKKQRHLKKIIEERGGTVSPQGSLF